jgi:transposase
VLARSTRAHAATEVAPLTGLRVHDEQLGRVDGVLEHGMLEADNNTSERAMRPVAVSRKNWLFAGSERGGRAAAVVFSLVETARLNGIEPYAYLRDVLQRINGHRQDRLEELLPMHWKPA